LTTWTKSIVEHLVGYAKRDLLVPAEPDVSELAAANAAAAGWCAEVNAVQHSEICAVPAERLGAERELLGELPSLRPEIGACAVSRKVDKLACVVLDAHPWDEPIHLGVRAKFPDGWEANHALLAHLANHRIPG
jgi:hypothetical protein